jgi:hypothetical protein
VAVEITVTFGSGGAFVSVLAPLVWTAEEGSLLELEPQPDTPITAVIPNKAKAVKVLAHGIPVYPAHLMSATMEKIEQKLNLG